MKVFRVDKVNKEFLCFEPRIPLKKSYDENHTTPRICCSPSLNGCLSSIDNLDYHDMLYVYECDIQEFYQPTEKEVYDSYLTGELWILKPAIFKKIGSLEITGYIGQDYKNRVNNQYAFNFIE